METNNLDQSNKESFQYASENIEAIFLASQILASADPEVEIFRAAVNFFRNSVYIGAIYKLEDSRFILQKNEEEVTSNLNLFKAELADSSEIKTFFSQSHPIIIKDIKQTKESVPTEILTAIDLLNFLDVAFIPIKMADKLSAFMLIGSRAADMVTKSNMEKYNRLATDITDLLQKVQENGEMQKQIENLKRLNDLGRLINTETDLENLYSIIHENIKENIGDLIFSISLYDADNEYISFPYMYEQGVLQHIDPIPIGQGLTSVVIQTRQPLLLVENIEKQALSLGAKIVGPTAKSWLGVPLMVGSEVIGIMTIQDAENEDRFAKDDLDLMTNLAAQMSGAINSTRLLDNSKRYSIQLETASQIVKEVSGILDKENLLSKAIHLIKDRFGLYLASVYLLDHSKEYAVILDSTGEAGQKMLAEKHKLKVGSQSVIGHVTSTGESLVVNDVTGDPMHHHNPMLPDTKAELGIPLKLGRRILGALNLQSTQAYSFSTDDVEVLQILADQLAVAVSNADLYEEAQKSLEQQQLIQHITANASSTTNLEEALNASVQGLHTSLGDRIAILLFESNSNRMNLAASAGYEEDILELQIEVGQGITGWVADTRKPAMVNNVLEDSRYIEGMESVRSELAVPLIYREELLGVLNIESDELNAYTDRDQNFLSTVAGNMATVIANARLSDRQKQLFEITNNIRRSVDVGAILQTTADELNKALNTRRTKIEVGMRAEEFEPTVDVNVSNGKDEIQ